MAEKAKMSQTVDARNEETRIRKPKTLYCHQCRQKRPNAVGNCITRRRTTTCAVKYCPPCFARWYPEMVEEVASNNWLCFRCRGICSCSVCPKRVSRRRKARRCSVDSSAGCSNEIDAARTEPVPRGRKKLEEAKLPEGTEAIAISGVDLPPEHAGSVLQFLQFSSTFGEAIGFGAGEAQLVVREILLGRSTRSHEHSTLTQILIKLLNVILAEQVEKSEGLSASDDSWFTFLGECLLESEVQLDEFPSEMFQKGISEYDKMDASQRLKLLNFLCDETLNTAALRSCMAKPESFKKLKEAKEKVKAAEAKERQLWQKIEDELAKAKALNNGVELTLQQHAAIISLMDAESEQVIAEKESASEMLKNLEYDDELRTRPFELDDNGRIFWKLKSYKEESNILLQDLGSRSDECPHEKWFAFSPEQKPEVEKYITRKRKRVSQRKAKGCSVDSSAGCSNENAEARTEPVPRGRKKLEEAKLPEGTEAIAISGVDLPPEHAGSVLQFLQFSSTFGEAIGFGAGEAQLVVREILLGRSTRSHEHSTLTQILIKLLNVILAEQVEKSDGLSASDDSWFTFLGERLLESEVQLDEFPPEMFQKGISEYDKMDASQRLKLLNFLCDETLNTAALRSCMAKPESFEKEKEAKEKVKAAEAKERQFDQKMKDEMAKAQAANNGVELTCGQRCAIFSLMEAESAQIFAEKKNASDMLKNLQYDDELRTRPFELDDNGRIFWKLKSYKEESNILLQDLGSRSDGCPHEKWFAFSPEQKPEVEKYISRKREKEKASKKKRKTVLN